MPVEATKRPWAAEANYISAIVPDGRPNGEIIAHFMPTADSHRDTVPNEANADFAVRAVNSYDTTLAALETSIRLAEANFPHSDPRAVVINLAEIATAARAALALAKGETDA